jgi:hypothetical protein
MRAVGLGRGNGTASGSPSSLPPSFSKHARLGPAPFNPRGALARRVPAAAAVLS